MVTAHVVIVDNSFTDGSAAAILRQIQSCLVEYFQRFSWRQSGAEEPESVKHS